MKKYIFADTQDMRGSMKWMTLEEVRDFLTDYWFEDLEEDDPYFNRIEKADYIELCGMLEPLEFTLCETIEEYQEETEAWERLTRDMKTFKPKQSKEDTINYFKQLASEFEKDSKRYDDLIARGKAEAYELAAFELQYNME